MATSISIARPKKARKRSAAPALQLTFILKSKSEGEHIAKVYEKATHRCLATARGTEDYVQGASALFAREWERGKIDRRYVISWHQVQADRLRRVATSLPVGSAAFREAKSLADEFDLMGLQYLAGKVVQP